MGLFDGPGDREGGMGGYGGEARGTQFSGGVGENFVDGTHNFDRFSSNNDDNGPSQPSPQPYTPGTTFRGMGPAGSGVTLRTGPAGQIFGVVDKRVSPSGYQSPTYNQAFADRMYSGSDQTNFRGERMPTASEQIMEMRQQATQNPRNIFGEEGFSYDYSTTAPGEALPNRTYGDKVMLDGREVDLVTGYTEPSVGDIVATTLGSMGLGGPIGLLGGKETYIAGEEPDNLQQQPGLAGLFAKAMTGATSEQLASKGAGMADRLQSFFKGPSEKATSPQATNIPSPQATEIDAMAQDPANMTATAPRPMAQIVASPPYEGGPTYDENYALTRPFPTSVPEPLQIARANEGSAMGPYQTVDIATPVNYSTDTPNYGFDRPVNAPNYGMYPIPEADMDAMASYRGSRATTMPADFTASFADVNDPRGNQMAPTPGEGYGAFGPRTADDLRSMGIEPTMQDLQDMNLSPAEFLQESQRLRENQPVRQANDVSVAQIVPGSAFERATGVNLPRGRSVDLETMQVIRDSDGRIEGDVRALMRNKGMTFQELISLPGLRSSFAPDNTTG